MAQPAAHLCLTNSLIGSHNTTTHPATYASQPSQPHIQQILQLQFCKCEHPAVQPSTHPRCICMYTCPTVCAGCTMTLATTASMPQLNQGLSHTMQVSSSHKAMLVTAVCLHAVQTHICIHLHIHLYIQMYSRQHAQPQGHLSPCHQQSHGRPSRARYLIHSMRAWADADTCRCRSCSWQLEPHSVFIAFCAGPYTGLCGGEGVPGPSA